MGSFGDFLRDSFVGCFQEFTGVGKVTVVDIKKHGDGSRTVTYRASKLKGVTKQRVEPKQKPRKGVMGRDLPRGGWFSKK